MEINKIIQFRTVFEAESIRSAANILAMSPGSLSKAVKSLEREIDLELFVQKGRNIYPTDEAINFYHRSTKLVESFEELMETKALEPTKKQQQLTIASWEVFTSYFVSHLAETHLKDYKLRVLERTPHLLEKSILKGQAHIGITYAPIVHKDLSILKVCQFTFGIFARKGFFDDQSLDTIPFAIPITSFLGSPTGVKTLDEWPTELDRKFKYEFELLETALQTTRKGLSAIHCPNFIVHLQNQEHKELVALDLLTQKQKKRSDIFLVFRKASAESLEIKKIAKALRLVCKQQ